MELKAMLIERGSLDECQSSSTTFKTFWRKVPLVEVH
jgi:hypothetical protein